MGNALLRTKSPEQHIADAEAPERKLKRSLGPLDLMALGVGATIGAGIFALTGTAAAGQQTTTAGVLDTPLLGLVLGQAANGRPAAGPAIMISFLIVAIACGFAGFCYAELAAMIPVAGSAYTYAYATLGELFAWVIGWDLILEYAVGNIAVASSWSGYFLKLAYSLLGLKMPLWLVTDAKTAGAILEAGAKDPASLAPYSSTDLPHVAGHAVALNLPAGLVVLFITWLLVRGMRESAAFNTAAVIFKVAVVIFFIAFGAFYVNPSNWHPFAPNGVQGVMSGAAIVFFAFIGFDAVSTAAQESRNPKRDMPIGILGSLALCTVLYILFAHVLTGLAPVEFLRHAGKEASVSKAIDVFMPGYTWLSNSVTVAILGGFSSVILVMLMGQSRVFYSMSKDGLVPSAFSDLHPKYRTPYKSNLLFLAFVGLFAAFVPGDIVGDMTSIGTLFAFILVSIGVWVLRVRQPELPRPFRTPIVPVVSTGGVLACGLMIWGLGWPNWARLAVWLVIGLVLYFSYGRKHSRVQAALGI
jgi:APA family basic amino acid/polyamine antiporter